MSSGLQFQDFGLGGADSPFTSPSVNSNYDNRNTERDSANLVDGSEAETAGNQYSFLSFKFYQQYFDVDTEQVYTRILNSAFPKKGGNFIRDHVQPSPDLYGPLWISVTLVFCASICGNLARYIDTLGADSSGSDFRLVTGISTTIACYVTLVPLVIYILMYYRNTTLQYTYAELIALYGYSLAIFIPVSILWVIHYQWLRWSLIVVSIALSGFVLGSTILDAIKTDKNKVLVLGVVCGVVVLHAGLAIGMKEYYFDSVLPPKPSNDVLPQESSKLPLTNDPGTKADGLPKPQALQSPKEPLPKPDDKKETPKKPAEQALEVKTDGKQDAKPSGSADQKPVAKVEDSPKDKPDVKS